MVSLELLVLSGIIAGALVLFVGGWLRVDLVGLMVLSALALTGLITAQEALAGFSSPAVVTVWALFILSAGLTRTGIAHQIGQPLQRFAAGSEITLMILLMVVASLLSALINTVTVAAILLPSTMELARRSGRSPARLLLPLALGCLLGGPFTGISTPPNILVTDAMRNAGLTPFAIFDFTPITGAIVAGGIVFMVLIGRHFLPKTTGSRQTDQNSMTNASYQLEAHIFTTRIPETSALSGRTLAESRLGSALYLTVLALQREGALTLAPGPNDVLQSGDVLVVHGVPEHLERYHASQHLQIESMGGLADTLFGCLKMAEGVVADGSPLSGSTLPSSGLRRKHQVHVVTLYDRQGNAVRELRRHQLAAGERLILQGEQANLDKLVQAGLLSDLRVLEAHEWQTVESQPIELLPVRVPEGSVLAGRNLVESRLGNAFGLVVVGRIRNEELACLPSPEEVIQAGDLLILQGSRANLAVLEALQTLEIVKQSASLMADLESQQIGTMEVLLSPRTSLADRTLGELLFRERYGISVLAIWRRGRALHQGLQDMPLQFGDALLVYGARRHLATLARDSDFLVLDQEAAQAPRLEKAGIAVVIMLTVIISSILGLLPISIAALIGATIMVLLGCLSMEEAYRSIEWKVIFLIASMLPLGNAVQNTGAAEMAAAALIAAAGDYGPRWVVAALFTVTVLATQIIPTAALVVLMVPIALSAAATLEMSPHLLMMTVAMSASASFASPLSHPAHLLVMGPGGYRFVDYMKVGVPLTLIALAVSVWLLPIFWPPYG